MSKTDSLTELSSENSIWYQWWTGD